MNKDEKFWETMFEELNKTSQKDWKRFVEKHDTGVNKMNEQLFLRY